jgi:error-prone DNA polymerase
MERYAPLWCKSNFSFLEGASHPEELVAEAHALGLPALALADRDGVYGLPRAHVRAQELGLKLIAGAQVTLDQGARVVLLAEHRQGYANLCRLLTRGRLRSPKGLSSVTLDDLCEHAPGLVALYGPGLADRDVGALRDAFAERLYARIARHLCACDVAPEAALRAQATRLSVPTVAACEVLYHTRERRPLQDVLACLRAGVTLATAGRHTRPNAEHALLPDRILRARFEDDPQSVWRTRELAERCAFSLDQLRYRYPSERLPDGTTTAEWLRHLTFEGARQRYGETLPDAVVQQLERELAVIRDLDYEGYFLTMWEIVEYCKAHGILCQGRGSAANSAVCYCLSVTAVDPVRMELLFERFLSRERHEPPDIDLDIAHERREEVIQHVYRKYGRDRAAMVAVVVRYRTKSAIRDVGRVLGVPETALDRLAKLSSRYDGDWQPMLAAAGLDPKSRLPEHLVRLVDEIRDFPRHLSIHPGGFLLGHEPVDTIVPIENGAMQDRTVIQWDKDDIETLGLFKVDLLGLGALTLVDGSLALLRAHRGLDLELATIPKEDPDTYEMACQGDTVGVFQIESRAQMAMLPRLRPRSFYDLVIEISIVRPGPIAGDMVHPYLRRRHGEEEIVYPHPCLEPVLKKTLGVPLFQEQVMRLAVVAADYTPGEADQLRRDMAAWRKTGRIERHRERLCARMRQKGIEPEFAERVFEQIRGFGEYGFPESHAASFALIAYATAWLKCHHADVFACALLNAQPMGFYSPATIVDDAKRHGVPVLPIDVQRSAVDCTLEGTGERWLGVRMGLRWVKGLGAAAARIAGARPFADLQDLVRRARPNEKQLAALAECGALEPLAPSRRQALWDVTRLAHEPPTGLALPARDPAVAFPSLDPFETIAWDYRQSGHSARGHPLGPARALLRRQRLLAADAVRELRDGTFARTAGLVICRQRPGTANGVVFLTLEDETGFVNVVLWQKVFDRFAVLVKGEPFLGVAGKVQRQDGVVHVIARQVFVPRLEVVPESGGSRDFH